MDERLEEKYHETTPSEEPGTQPVDKWRSTGIKKLASKIADSGAETL